MAELTLPQLLGDLWETIGDIHKLRKVESSFYRHMQECADAHPHRTADDWESVVHALRDCHGHMKAAMDDIRQQNKDKDEMTRYSVKKLLDLHVFYSWEHNIECLLHRGHTELEAIVASIIDVVQSTSLHPSPPLAMILSGLRAATEGENHFKVALIWSQVCR